MKKFITIWCGELISCIGSGMTAFAISIYMYQLTSSVALVSLASLLAYLPTILLNPLGGILADRYDRRLMMILGDSLSAIGLLIILLSIQTGHEGAAPVLIGITISSVFGALLEPAYKATVTDLLSEEEYAKASGLVQMAGNAKYLISPAIAGMILAVSDLRLILILDIATFFVTVIAVASVRKSIKEVKPLKKEFHILKEFSEGWNSITREKGVMSLVVLMAFMCFFIAFIQTLITPMALAFADSKTIGMIESISAIGMVIGCIVIGVSKIDHGYSGILKIGLVVAGIFMALVGTTTNLWLMLVYCVLFFMALPFVNTCADVLIRMRIPNEVQGRAWGMISVLTQIGYVVAYAICGVLADYVFNPMLMDDGILADSVGKIIGTGEGRGIGFMLVLTGIMMVIFAFLFGGRKSIRELERSKNELAHN